MYKNCLFKLVADLILLAGAFAGLEGKAVFAKFLGDVLAEVFLAAESTVASLMGTQENV